MKLGLSSWGFPAVVVMPGLVPGIHALKVSQQEDADGRVRRAEATPSFGRLCPAMTKVMGRPLPSRSKLM
jgi:hypothetical protein